MNRIDPVFPDTVTIFNLIGEENGVPVYTAAIVRRVRCSLSDGSDDASDGISAAVSGRVYMMSGYICSDKPYIEFAEWEEMDARAKGRFWTLRGGGTELIAEGYHADAVGSPLSLRETSRILSLDKRTGGSAKLLTVHVG